MRSCTFGPCLGPESKHTTHTIAKPCDGPISALYYNDPLLERCHWITSIGVALTNPSSLGDHVSESSIPRLSKYSSLYYGDMSNRLCEKGGTYMTLASLEKIWGIQTCKDTSQDQQPIIGLLLHYLDGSREALGQWSFERTCSEITTDVHALCYEMEPLLTPLGPHPWAITMQYPKSATGYYIKDVWFSPDIKSTSKSHHPDSVRGTQSLQGNMRWWIHREYNGTMSSNYLTFDG